MAKFTLEFKIFDTTPHNYVEGEGMLEDRTSGEVDEFLVSAITPSTFTCATTGWTIKLWPGASGWKDTGQSGQKEVNPGATWLGSAILYDPDLNPIEEFDPVVGTWNTTVEEGDCFNYGGRPPIYSAHWVVGDSDPDGLTGEGGSAGDKQPEE